MKKGYLCFIYVFFYFPILVLMVYSFNDARYSLLWHGATWHWYAVLFHDQDLWVAALHSFVLAAATSTVATTVGVLTTTLLYRYEFKGRYLINGLLFILILSPEIVIGVTLLLLFTMIKLPFGFLSLLLAHISFCIPFVIVTLYSRLLSLDKNIFEAAKDLGANDWLIFIRILLPLVAPALLASWLLSFTLSLDDVIISYFVAGPEFEILPLRIYSLVRAGIKPELNALCTILFCITCVLIMTAQRFTKNREKHRPLGQ